MACDAGPLAVVARHIYLRYPTKDGATYVPISDPAVGVSIQAGNRLVHAVEHKSIAASRDRHRITFDSSCSTRTKFGITLRVADAPETYVVPPWPPRAGDLPSDVKRCPRCLKAHRQSLDGWDGLFKLTERSTA